MQNSVPGVPIKLGLLHYILRMTDPDDAFFSPGRREKNKNKIYLFEGVGPKTDFKSSLSEEEKKSNSYHSIEFFYGTDVYATTPKCSTTGIHFLGWGESKILGTIFRGKGGIT